MVCAYLSIYVSIYLSLSMYEYFTETTHANSKRAASIKTRVFEQPKEESYPLTIKRGNS